MQPSRQEGHWRAQWQSRPGSSTDHKDTQRRLHGSYSRHEYQDHDEWPPRSTSRLQQRGHANSAPTPPWRDRVKLPERRTQGGARWIPSDVHGDSQRRQPPVRRWRSPEPPLRLRKSELDSSRDSRSWAQRHQDPHPLRVQRPPDVAGLGGGHASDPVVDQRWDSEVAQEARFNRRQWVPNTSHYDYYDNDDGDDDDEEEEEDSNEQSNFTLKHCYSPPARSYERRQDDRADHRLQRNERPIRLSDVDHVGVLHNQVPSWPARRQLSRRVAMSARRWSQSEMFSQDSQSETNQERATQSLTTRSVDVQSYLVCPTRQQMVETGNATSSMVRRPPHTFENKNDEPFDNSEDNRPDSNGHSTSKRRPSARGKRKATLKQDVTTVEFGCEPREEIVAIEPNISACESVQRSHRTRKRHYKRCQYPEGCQKRTQGSTMFCVSHGGGKRCQYPEGCDKSAGGRTMFCRAHGGGRRCQYPDGCGKGAEGTTKSCIAHGGGKRCQYPDGCGKGAEGSTAFCVEHGGGKRCQYPEGCDKSAIGRTLFCIAHGGGKRCQYPEGCDKSAIGRTLFCIAHGGGKRCQYPEGCDKSALGSTMFCIAHGGGKRCQFPDGCDKGAEGSTMYCKIHGGGKRCQYPEGCDKSALGRTLFCRAHGGGKRCQYPDGCSKGAEGRTSFCKAHGGGRRCQYPEGCGKSAQGSTMFCIAHGGGRRCGHDSGCHKLVARGGLCKSHGAEAGV
jgi:hypothetical protein